MRKPSSAAIPEGDLFSFASRQQSTVRESQTVELDEHFARLMMRLDGRNEPALAAAARAVSASRSSGNIYLPLAKLESEFPFIRQILKTCPMVGKAGDWKPLILVSDRLYLHRYWDYEQRLAAAILSRVTAAVDDSPTSEDEKSAKTFLGENATDQLEAVRSALSRRLCIIIGGPGTGKTRTAATLLAVSYEKAVRSGKPGLRVAMAAPTGKAAARLTESVRKTLSAIAAPLELQELQAVTLHRLLGTRPDAPAPRYHGERPLAVDLVIVDEASMIDLATMAKLLLAVPRTARLILLGDRDQLASIDAGHVLGDLCEAAEQGSLPGIVVDLRHTYRFAAGSGIAALSSSLKAGDVEGSLQILEGNSWPDLASIELPFATTLAAALKERALSGYRALVTAQTAEEAVKALTKFCLLAGVRRGPFGVENLNRTVERILSTAGLIDPGTTHYPNRPIMILSNDYSLRLFNGDVGVIMPDPESNGELRAFFEGMDGGLRRYLPARLPDHETVWAMTIHKSQGSEFDQVLVVLPDREAPTLSRELIYTAVSRARKRVEVWHRASVLRMAIARTVERASGLPDALAKGASANALGAPLGGS